MENGKAKMRNKATLETKKDEKREVKEFMKFF